MRKIRRDCPGLAARLLRSASGQPKNDKDASSPPVSWELKPGGQWQQVTSATTQPVVQDEMLKHRVEEMLQSKQAEAAHKLCLAWIRSHQQSPIRDRAVYLLGMANFMIGERYESYYNFDEVLDLYPGSRYFYPSLEQQYIIADQFLKGYKMCFLGMAILDGTAEATEILYRIQQRAPGSPLAEKSLLRVADYFYANSDFENGGRCLCRVHPRLSEEPAHSPRPSAAGVLIAGAVPETVLRRHADH